MKYCEFCGTQLEGNNKCSCAEAQAKQQKQAKTIKTAMIIGIPIIILIIVVSLIFSTVKTDPFDFVSVTFEGVDGYGEANIDIDTDAMIYSVMDEEPEDLDEYWEWLEKYDALSEGIDYSVDNTEDLSNSDEVTIVFTITGEAANKFKNASKTFEVSGLKTVEMVDVFDYIDISFEGMNGYGSVKIIKNTDADSFIDAIHFKASDNVDNGKLLNGSEIEIIAICEETVAETYGKVPKEHSMFVTVEGLRKYVTIDTLPTGLLQVYAEKFANEKQSQLIDDSMFSYSNVEVDGIYFAKAKPDASTYTDNEIHILISYTQYLHNEYHSTIYLPLIFVDVAFSDDETVDIEYEDGTGTGFFYTDIEEYLNNLAEDYTVTKVA